MPDEIDDIEIPERDEEITDQQEEDEEADYDSELESQDVDLTAMSDKIAKHTYDPREIKEPKKAKKKSKPKKKAVKKKAIVKKQVKQPRKINKRKMSIKATPVKKAKKKVIKPKVKKQIVTKSHKRGPKGVQWKTWRIPYQESSTAGKIFLKAIEKNGITIKELTKISKQAGSNPVRNLKCLRSGKCRGWIWHVEEAHDRIRVTKHHIVDKSWKGW